MAATGSVLYRFGHARDYDTILFQGVSLPVEAFVSAVLDRRKLSGDEVALTVFDEQTGQELRPKHTIPRTARVVVRLTPRPEGYRLTAAARMPGAAVDDGERDDRQQARADQTRQPRRFAAYGSAAASAAAGLPEVAEGTQGRGIVLASTDGSGISIWAPDRSTFRARAAALGAVSSTSTINPAPSILPAAPTLAPLHSSAGTGAGAETEAGDDVASAGVTAPLPEPVDLRHTTDPALDEDLYIAMTGMLRATSDPHPRVHLTLPTVSPVMLAQLAQQLSVHARVTGGSGTAPAPPPLPPDRKSVV